MITVHYLSSNLLSIIFTPSLLFSHGRCACIILVVRIVNLSKIIRFDDANTHGKLNELPIISAIVMQVVRDECNATYVTLLRDPGTFCMTNILTHKTLIFVFQGPSGMRKTWVPTLNFPDFFMGHFFLTFYTIFHIGYTNFQTTCQNIKYMVVAYQKVQNDDRVLKIYISIISVYENREINAKPRENVSRGV